MVVAVLTVVALLAPTLAPYDPMALGDMALSVPSCSHPMGTDHLGRDILSAAAWGIRISLLVGVCSAVISLVVGICIGAPAGYFGGRLDGLLMRLTDAFMVLPTFFLILIVVAIFGGSVWKLIAMIGITNWPPIARVVRAEFLSLREREFVGAAKAVGVGHLVIMARHILPNALPVVIPTASLRTAGAIITEASLSFLGVGDANVISLGPDAHARASVHAHGLVDGDVPWLDDLHHGAGAQPDRRRLERCAEPSPGEKAPGASVGT